MKKLFSLILFLGLLLGGVASAEITLVCKFTNGISYMDQGKIERFKKDDPNAINIKDDLFKINHQGKELFEIRNSEVKKIKDTEWDSTFVKWSYKVIFDDAISENKINRYSGEYIAIVKFGKNSGMYKNFKLFRTEWYYQCSKSSKMF